MKNLNSLSIQAFQDCTINNFYAPNINSIIGINLEDSENDSEMATFSIGTKNFLRLSLYPLESRLSKCRTMLQAIDLKTTSNMFWMWDS